MNTLVAMLVASVALIPVSGFLFWYLAREAKRQDELWAEAARALGARFLPGGAFWIPDQSRRIEAVIAGCPVTIDHRRRGFREFATSRGGGNEQVVCLQAPAAAPPPFELRLLRPTGFSPLARAVGMQDVVIGHAELDARFVIKTQRPEAARSWLHPETVRHALAQADPTYEFWIAEGHARAQRTGMPHSAPELVRAAYALAALASGPSAPAAS